MEPNHLVTGEEADLDLGANVVEVGGEQFRRQQHPASVRVASAQPLCYLSIERHSRHSWISPRCLSAAPQPKAPPPTAMKEGPQAHPVARAFHPASHHTNRPEIGTPWSPGEVPVSSSFDQAYAREQRRGSPLRTALRPIRRLVQGRGGGATTAALADGAAAAVLVVGARACGYAGPVLGS